MNDKLSSQLDNLPTDPGIYKYFDADNELIYVGKAVNLRNRVKSYFNGNDHSPKTKVLVSKIDRLETIVVRSEVDALILETNLIKQYRPRYNIILKDDKSHLYIKITLYEDLPRVATCRQTDLKFDTKANYYGPFPSGGTVKQTLRYLRRVFPYIARHQPPVVGKRRPPQSYFYFNLPLGPVDEVIDKKQYRQQIFQLVHFLEGQRLQVADEITKAMKKAAKELKFEQAAALKQQLDGLTYISQQTIRPESYVSNPELVVDKRNLGLRQLAESLTDYFPHLSTTTFDDVSEENLPLQRIECYDISNTSGEQAVGSMIVFDFGQPKKSDYRKFRIKRDNVPNDVAMLQEVLRRRFKRLEKDQASDDSSFAALPSLIVIDGGKGQLSAAAGVLSELRLDIPVVGMTKREEELILMPDGRSRIDDRSELASSISFDDDQSTATNDRSPKPNRSGAHAAFARTDEEAVLQTKAEANFTTIRLPRGSEGLFLIQRLRDEAHRFAITYHRKLRGKDFIPNK